MPLYRSLTCCHRPLVPKYCSLTPLCRLLMPLLKPSMPFHRPILIVMCYVLFYDMFWQYNQIMHYILDILNINMT